MVFWGNIIEAALWFAIAAALAIRRPALPDPASRRRALAAAVAFAAFGVTDLVETRTGAWYRPPALLAANAACVTALAACAIGHYAARRRAGRVTPAAGSSPRRGSVPRERP